MTGETPDVGVLFDDGSEHFAHWTPLLWAPIGRKLAAMADPGVGERVLDACCGTGASALPAANAVGPSGWVDAVDLSEQLIAEGRVRAAEARLRNLRFVRADITEWLPVANPYDVVQCGFGVFFLPEMDTDCQRLVRLLRPGGRFALTSWASGSLESVFQPFFAAAVEQRPELANAPKPPQTTNSERLLTEEAVGRWLADRGLVDVRTSRVEHEVPVDATLAWRFLQSGPAKAVLAGLTGDAVARVREGFRERLESAKVRTLSAPFIVARGTVPASTEPQDP
ncbi:class I SAM-dependent methyltransferase [Tamaricihabitans halophyticus]|nr:methyltransferase domain-containing protein [Tamaricihabitans halophyticus]